MTKKANKIVSLELPPDFLNLFMVVMRINYRTFTVVIKVNPALTVFNCTSSVRKFMINVR